MSDQVHNKIQEEIKANPILLYMKGTKFFPMCGFSKTVCDILAHLNIEFETRNVLDDPELRDGIKSYSNWPTIPQLYVNGEFVGGCDIVRELFEKGELEAMLKNSSSGSESN